MRPFKRPAETVSLRCDKQVLENVVGLRIDHTVHILVESFHFNLGIAGIQRLDILQLGVAVKHETE